MKMCCTGSHVTTALCALSVQQHLETDSQEMWVWDVNVAQNVAMFIQWYNMCTLSYVVHKVQSRFLVKQEVCFYLCCTEQLLEQILHSIKQSDLGGGGLKRLWRRSDYTCIKTLGSDFPVSWNSNLLGIYLTRWATFCSGEQKILMHEALHDWLHAQSCGWEQQQAKPQLLCAY